MAAHGRYTILGKLADGGMAEIFLAIQHGAEGFEKPVVLKRILTQYSADPQFRNMLLDEAHISMSLQHSNIAQVLDFGVAGGRYFLALELVDGWDLEKILHRAHAAGMIWPAALGLHVVACVCRALAYAHAKTRDGKPLEIVHRDISPNNVLISDQGEVKLADFGIAKAQRKREQTAAGVIKGKVAYMSPEQALGGQVDRRSDIFSVGSLLYRMMTEKLPFEAPSDMESLLKVQKADFPPPEQARPTVGPAVAAIIMKAMRLVPGERYQTADEMLADVERVLRNEFHSAGQTELKLWLEQLARRDHVSSIGKQRVDTSGLVKDAMGTDLSAGTSFELDDLDKASAQTELATGRPPPRAEREARVAGGGEEQGRRDDGKSPGRKGASTAQIALAAGRRPARRGGGFWLGVAFALAVVLGVRYLLGWAERKGVVDALGFGEDAASQTAAEAAAPPGPEPLATPPGPSAPAEPVIAASPVDAEPALADGATRGETVEAAPSGEKAEEKGGDEDDEEALLRGALPHGETAVIGEEEAEAPAPKAAGAKAGAAKARPAPAGKANKVETAAVQITSAPKGAVVRTKSRVLGRTPISVRFISGNSYELTLVKKGYVTATRRVTVNGPKEKKLAVTLKKKAAPKKRPFFRPHR